MIAVLSFRTIRDFPQVQPHLYYSYPISSPLNSFINFLTGKVKAQELRSKSKEQVHDHLNAMRNELYQLRIAKVSGQGGAHKLSKLKVVRKNIARALTVVSQKQREAIRAAYKGKAAKPIAIRAKKTRAIRRALTPSEKSVITLRLKKKLNYFPKLKIAIKA